MAAKRKTADVFRQARAVSNKDASWPDVPDSRRRIMAAIRSRDTEPELSIRKLIHGYGYRFVTGRRVAGVRPDLLFTRRHKAIFVHGCFWHGHRSCGRDKIPKTRSDYWCEKIARNKQRDERALSALKHAGWDVLVLWECEIQPSDRLISRLTQFLGPTAWTSS